MSDRYDEDIYENPFYNGVEKSLELFEQAAAKRWIICVPRFSCASRETIKKEDFEEHVLIQDDSSAEKYHTVSKHAVTIKQGVITLGEGFLHPKKVSILFEETCYNNKDESYRVLCVSEFFNREPLEDTGETEMETYKPPATYEECLNILWGNNRGHSKTREQLDKVLQRFCTVYNQFDGENLMTLVDLVSEQVTEAMQIMLKDLTVRQSLKHSTSYMSKLRVALEIYMMNGVHKHLFATITTLVKSQDAEVNKMTRNHLEVRLQHLGVGKEFSQNIPLAKKEIAKLNDFSTPLRRLIQLKRVVNALTRRAINSSDNTDIMMSSDEILPLLIYLIIKSQIPNWTANMVYMRYFHTARVPEDDEFSYYLATIEAALDYIRSGNLKLDQSPAKKVQSPKHMEGGGSDKAGIKHQGPAGSSTTKERFFQYVHYGDEAAVSLMLQKSPTSSNAALLSQLCHPLCSCEKCVKLIAKSKQNTKTVSPNSRDDMGRTALHIASQFGRANLIDILFKHGCLVDATDFLNCTPLHLACQAGHQNVILMLVHFGADISTWDNEKNTPLHMCTANGHEDCVKAILFLDILKNRLNVNAQNDMGDTPLHLAAKWGYEGIVRFLLDTEADPRIRNRKKQTPLDLAQNKAIKHQLQEAVNNQVPIITRRTQVAPNTLPLKPPPPPTSPLPPAPPDKSSTPAESDGFDVIDVHVPPRKKMVVMKENPEVMSPKTPEVASLDQADVRKRELLFRAIQNGDIPLVKFHLGWIDDSPEDEVTNDLSPLERSLCHPLCQCAKCKPIQKLPQKGGINVNSQNMKGFSPLHITILEKKFELCKLFLKKGAKPNPQTQKRITPLHLACFHTKAKFVEELLKYGASVNMLDTYGEIPLHLACAKRAVDIVELLIQHSSNVNQKNVEGNTPLHHAANTDNLDLIRILLKAGANPNIQNLRQQTPLSLAKEERTQRCLLDCMATQIPSSHRSVSETSISAGSRPSHQGQGHVGSPASGKPSLKQLFASFEENDLRMLKDLNFGVRSFDKTSSLKRSQTFDRGGEEIRRLRHSTSIQQFDHSTLRHVNLVDKSSPMYIYNLSYHDRATTEEPSDLDPQSKGENCDDDKGGKSSSQEDLKGDNLEDISAEEDEIFYEKDDQDGTNKKSEFQDLDEISERTSEMEREIKTDVVEESTLNQENVPKESNSEPLTNSASGNNGNENENTRTGLSTSQIESSTGIDSEEGKNTETNSSVKTEADTGQGHLDVADENSKIVPQETQDNVTVDGADGQTRLVCETATGISDETLSVQVDSVSTENVIPPTVNEEESALNLKRGIAG